MLMAPVEEAMLQKSTGRRVSKIEIKIERKQTKQKTYTGGNRN